MRAIRAEARPHGHDVSPVPARQPDARPVLPRLRRPPRARLRAPVAPNYPAGARFCRQCGQRRRRRAPRPPARSPTPETYTPKHLAEKILTSKAALEGERKQVTVLFADLKGSMELLADRDPEEARKLLDPVLERMMEAVHRYEGTVNQVMGDGIMALFGAPLAHEDHAVRACYAALDMQGAIRRYAEEVSAHPRRRRADPRRAELGRGRGPRHRQRSAHGLHRGRPDDAPGRADGAARDARAPSCSPPTRCAWPRATSTVKPLGPVPVKGLEAPVEVYELIGRRARCARGSTPRPRAG